MSGMFILRCNHEDCERRTQSGMCVAPFCENPQYYAPPKKAQTNAEVIRAMSDEELATFIAMACPIGFKCNAVEPYEDESPEHHCARCLLPWLKSPAEGEK